MVVGRRSAYRYISSGTQRRIHVVLATLGGLCGTREDQLCTHAVSGVRMKQDEAIVTLFIYMNMCVLMGRTYIVDLLLHITRIYISVVYHPWVA